jgi:hypothetical protein
MALNISQIGKQQQSEWHTTAVRMAHNSSQNGKQQQGNMGRVGNDVSTYLQREKVRLYINRKSSLTPS